MISRGGELMDRAWHRSISEIIPNLLFFGFGVMILVVLAEWFRWLAMVGFAAYGIICVINVIRLIVALAIWLMLLVSGKAELRATGAMLVQLIEAAVFAVYTAVLYWVLFGSS